ncbi:hypothetical protein [Aeropyrum pernix]|nr:hypothetical protein [Aeropyrum pernix]
MVKLVAEWARANRLAITLMVANYPAEVRPLPRGSKNGLVVITPWGDRIEDPGDEKIQEILDYRHVYAGYIVD